MRITENKMRKKLQKDIGTAIEFFKIESGDTEIAIPDTYYRGKGFDGWIELKQMDIEPVKLNYCEIKIAYRPGQLNWLRTSRNLGLRVFLLLRINDNYYLIDYDFRHVYNGLIDLENVSICISKYFYLSKFVNCLRGL